MTVKAMATWQAVGEAVVEVLRPIQERFARYMQDKGQLETLIKQGAERAALASRRTLDKAMKRWASCWSETNGHESVDR